MLVVLTLDRHCMMNYIFHITWPRIFNFFRKFHFDIFWPRKFMASGLLETSIHYSVLTRCFCFWCILHCHLLVEYSHIHQQSTIFLMLNRAAKHRKNHNMTSLAVRDMPSPEAPGKAEQNATKKILMKNRPNIGGHRQRHTIIEGLLTRRRWDYGLYGSTISSVP